MWELLICGTYIYTLKIEMILLVKQMNIQFLNYSGIMKTMQGSVNAHNQYLHSLKKEGTII